jgi:hypothetical protein
MGLSAALKVASAVPGVPAATLGSARTCAAPGSAHGHPQLQRVKMHRKKIQSIRPPCSRLFLDSAGHLAVNFVVGW